MKDAKNMQSFSSKQSDNLSMWFRPHKTTIDQKHAARLIRESAWDLAQVMVERTPAGPDLRSALRKLREAVWTCNFAIASSSSLPSSSSLKQKGKRK